MSAAVELSDTTAPLPHQSTALISPDPSPPVSPGWHDFVTSPPPDGLLFIVRRQPEGTVPVLAVWAPDKSGVLIGPEAWYLPWAYVTRWRIAPGGSSITHSLYNVIPSPKLTKAKWRDLHAHTPPAEDQSWVRRFTLDANPFKAAWVAAAEPYFLLADGWQLPWYLAWQWRPV